MAGDPLDTVRAYFLAVEKGDPAALDFYADGVEQVEHPNAIKPTGDRRGIEQMQVDFEKGKRLLSRQQYEVRSAVVNGERVAVEVLWTGELAVALGSLQPGDVMRVQSAIFFRVRDGKIVSQENYDCVDPLVRNA
jgi:ketosteroid isomerase-like protein